MWFVWQREEETTNVGKWVILSAEFVGSQHNMQQNFQNALVLHKHVRHLNIFLTMACNPTGDEIMKMLVSLSRCQIANNLDIISRVFRLKLEDLTNDIKNNSYVGKCIGGLVLEEYLWN